MVNSHVMKLLFASFLAFVVLMFSGCSGVIGETTVKVVDQDRHYYPIIQGQKLAIVYELENTGEGDFRIEEIQTSCGCIVTNDYAKVVPAGKSIFLTFDYDSKKNVGLAEHYIYVYGNLGEDNPIEISFDVHVVPGALYTKDYEELYQEEVDKSGGIEEFVDGQEHEKLYYTDEK